MTATRNYRSDIRAAIYTPERRLWLDPDDAEAITDDVLAAITDDVPAAITEERDALVEFAKVCAGDGYISTRATAKDLLRRLGITRGPR